MAYFIRVDGNAKIGSGHVMRCMTIAEELMREGARIRFLVSDDISAGMVRARGFEVIVLDSDPMVLSDDDALKILEYVDQSSDHVLVDSYGVNDSFFEILNQNGVKTTYIDDLYLYSEGSLEEPHRFNVDFIINYGFGVDSRLYEDIYFESNTKLLLGPAYAPVRRSFKEKKHVARDDVERILITSGSTNPNHFLETCYEAARKAFPEASIDVIVGNTSSFESKHEKDDSLNIHHGILDMSDLMADADIAISAGGTTLYELTAIGVPTIAIQIVDNQFNNVLSFKSSGLGLGILSSEFSIDLIYRYLQILAKK